MASLPHTFRPFMLLPLFIFLFSLCLSGQEIVSGSMKFAWAGGLNAPQFNAIDLNLDGIKDLLIFDRHGNRKLTFINHGKTEAIDYTYNPAFACKLPDLHDWVILADYNCDGKEDIFTYSNGGVRVFKNVSDTALQFSLVTDLLESFYYTGYVGILLTPVDYPAIADIDGDGDLDLLSFFGLGSYVEYHKNLSMEKFGNCDSLDYRLTDHCWGKFKESEGGNHITLNANCPYEDKIQIPGVRHTGSTMLALDLNSDGLKDLLLGDVDFPNLIALINGGTADSAFIVSQDSVFPSNNQSVRLFSFPAANLLDLDNDGLKDLVVTPFDPSLFISENYKSVWFYKNNGTNEHPVFEFQTDRFFQDDMLDFGSNAYPVLYDLNRDGLQDLLVGSYGYYDTSFYKNGVLHSEYVSRLAYYQNTGSASEPFFQLISDDLAGLSGLMLQAFFPAPGDMNGDNKPDLLLGQPDGSLVFFPNTGTASNIPLFGPPQWNYQQIDVGEYSTPQLFDLDKDGLTDLEIGERNGNLNYYRNTGSASIPVFTLITDSLGKVNVTNYDVSYDGFSTPFFFRDEDLNTLLLVGCEEGKIHFFKGIDQNLEGKFSETDALFTLIGIPPNSFRDGWRSAATMAHLSDAGNFDLITGNFSGGLGYFSWKLHPGISERTRTDSIRLQVYPNPADEFIHIETGRGSCSIQFINFSGQLVLEKLLSVPAIISTKNLPQGLYLIRLGNISQKVIIRH